MNSEQELIEKISNIIIDNAIYDDDGDGGDMICNAPQLAKYILKALVPAPDAELLLTYESKEIAPILLTYENAPTTDENAFVNLINSTIQAAVAHAQPTPDQARERK
jgi:hypothetical protein